MASNVSVHGPDEYETTSYCNGITGDDDHPVLVYRSDFLTTPFPKPVGRYAHLPIKSLRGIFDTPLNGVWNAVGPQIRDLLKARKIDWSSVDPARFFTYAPLGEEAKGSLGPVVIWVGVRPGSNIRRYRLRGLPKDPYPPAEERSRRFCCGMARSGPAEARRCPPYAHVDSSNATHHVRRFLTALLGVPLATREMEEEASQGTLTLWFHENKTKDGTPSNKVYGVMCGLHRFLRGLDEITKAIADCGILADLWVREIVKLQAKERQDAENKKVIKAKQRQLDDETEAIADVEALYDDVVGHWCDIKLHRTIGYVQYAPAISVDVKGGTLYTSDWAAFLAAEAKVRYGFEGNVVDLGSKYAPQDLIDTSFPPMFYPRPPDGSRTTFKFPTGMKLRIEGCTTKEDLAHPAEFDGEGQRCLMVGKVGNTTNLTVGRYAGLVSGLVSFTRNEVGVESVELGIYNSGDKGAEVFSSKGDSGSLVWHMTTTVKPASNHVTYCTPGWHLLDHIKKRFKYADFYRTTWSV
ncbi:hypothetical protein C8T65DRAFT_705345 [Cerioporus squamosus]|nr:hypothetical protein C8T65DRAFT_705345 [Cerioporus squamosus]